MHAQIRLKLFADLLMLLFTLSSSFVPFMVRRNCQRYARLPIIQVTIPRSTPQLSLSAPSSEKLKRSPSIASRWYRSTRCYAFKPRAGRKIFPVATVGNLTAIWPTYSANTTSLIGSESAAIKRGADSTSVDGVTEKGGSVDAAGSIDGVHEKPAMIDSLKEENLSRIFPSDKELTFDEPSHTYFLNGEKMRMSVTALVETYFEKFVPNEVVRRMMSGSNWPRPEYTHPDGKIYTADEITKQWRRIGKNARISGTFMHSNIERFFLSGTNPDEYSPEYEQFSQFYQDQIVARGFTPYRTEWRIVAPDVSLAGSVDLVCKADDGSYVIMDWKRSKKQPEELMDAYGKKAKFPIQHLDDCTATKYFLQLNLYRHILEHYYGLTVSGMVMGLFHPSNERYICIEVPRYEKEVQSLMQHLRAQIE